MYVKCILSLLRHKWFVFVAAFRLRSWYHISPYMYWRLIIHDWTKFLPSELPHYACQFYGPKNKPDAFILCWTRHQNRHEHHWEYWIPRTGHNRCIPPYPDNEPLKMSKTAVFEMVCDWLGAARSYDGKWPSDDWPWMKMNWSKIRLHSETRMEIEKILNRLPGINMSVLK